MDESGITIEEALQQAPKDLQDLLVECGGRYVCFNNKASPDENKSQVSSLLQKVQEMVKSSDHEFFSSKIYENVESILKNELCKRAFQVTEAHEKELKAYREKIAELERQIEALQSSSENHDELAELEKKVATTQKQLTDTETVMNDLLTRLREEMRIGIGDLKEGMVFGATIGVSSGVTVGPIGVVIGSFVGIMVGGLVQYIERRKRASKHQDTLNLYKRLNEEIAESLETSYSESK